MIMTIVACIGTPQNFTRTELVYICLEQRAVLLVANVITFMFSQLPQGT
jgi:hypothetical protein